MREEEVRAVHQGVFASAGVVGEKVGGRGAAGWVGHLAGEGGGACAVDVAWIGAGGKGEACVGCVGWEGGDGRGKEQEGEYDGEVDGDGGYIGIAVCCLHVTAFLSKKSEVWHGQLSFGGLFA